MERVRQREHDVKILAVEALADHLFEPLLPALISTRWTVSIIAVIQTNQPPVATLAVV